ncbi:hypothetical protein HRG_005952 [Hirsutella rhossiliensis]|uniref:Uncharacterized protein n=1 Tax=Hirsutella rhossiliensis TaxID=111463 RepID=A0A9P8MYR2_9HYPO|nr:uncharacterized protein HRG_05952 [Hirsutella rhossiliensis]KAH0963442.1 hypothetical protein HRG_05952 [Hirsutella rhossiliensis]
MKFTLATVLLVNLAGCGLASPATGMRNDLSMTSGTVGISASVQEKGTMIKEHLDKAVMLLKEVGKEEPAFGKPLDRATMTIDTLNKAIHNLFLQYQYKGNGTKPTGGYKPGGPRYGGRKPGGYGNPRGY